MNTIIATTTLVPSEVTSTIARARAAGVDPGIVDGCDRLAAALARTVATTGALATRGAGGDVDGMLLHSTDYLTMFSILAVGWQWLLVAAVATEARAAGRGSRELHEGLLLAAQYFLATEVPRIDALATLCESGEDSYARMKPDWF